MELNSVGLMHNFKKQELVITHESYSTEIEIACL
jgi:hypothetical protein